MMAQTSPFGRRTSSENGESRQRKLGQAPLRVLSSTGACPNEDRTLSPIHAGLFPCIISITRFFRYLGPDRAKYAAQWETTRSQAALPRLGDQRVHPITTAQAQVLGSPHDPG